MRGKVNIIAIVLIGGVVFGVWWLIIFSNVYLDNVAVKDAVSTGFNYSGLADDDGVRSKVKAMTDLIGKHMEDDGFGNQVEKPGLGIPPEMITVERDTVRNTILVRVEYQRTVKLSPFNKWKTLHFTPTKQGPIPIPGNPKGI